MNTSVTQSPRVQVDRYAATVLGRVTDEKERCSRGYQVAKLYFNIREYDVAKRYLSGFLTVKPNYAPAHKLMGQILESQHETKKAIDAYKTSLELDTNQKEVLLKICELYCYVDIDPERIKYWADRVEKVFPKKNIAFTLREKIYASRSAAEPNREEMAQLLTAELSKKPRDPLLRVKLMRLYAETGRINEAYSHIVEAEKKCPYPESREWYECLVDIYEQYERESGNVNGSFHQQQLAILNNLLSISIASASIDDCVRVLHKLDVSLQLVAGSQLAEEEWRVCYEEMKAQFFFHIGTFLFKKAEQNSLSWPEASQLAAACYLVSGCVQPPDIRTNWYKKASPTDRKMHERWYSIGCYRTSQVAHILADMGKQKGSGRSWAQQLQLEVCTQEGQEKLFRLLFSSSGVQNSRETSFLLQNSMFRKFTPKLPDEMQLREYDNECESLQPQNLQHVVWLALQRHTVGEKAQPKPDLHLFFDLYEGRVEVDESCAPETLCQFDIEAFLYLTVRCAVLRLDEHSRQYGTEAGRPRLLPSAICRPLCTAEQAQWWTAAYGLYTNNVSDELGKQRLVVQRGLDAIRMRSNNSIDPMLATHVARCFQRQWEEAVNAGANDIDARQSRTVYYWKCAIAALTRMEKSGVVRPAQANAMFAVPNPAVPSPTGYKACLEEGRFLLGRIYLDKGQVEQAIGLFELVDTPSAYLSLGKAYKELASQRANQSLSLVGDEDIEQTALLEKAKDALYGTFDRIVRDRNQSMFTEITTELDDIDDMMQNLGVTSVETPMRFRSNRSCVATPQAPLSSTVLRSNGSFLQQPTADEVDASPVIGHARHDSAVRAQSSPPHGRRIQRDSTGSQSSPSPGGRIRHDSYSATIRTLVQQLSESRKTIDRLEEKVSKLESQVPAMPAAPNPAYPPPPLHPAQYYMPYGHPYGPYTGLPAAGYLPYPGPPAVPGQPHLRAPVHAPFPGQMFQQPPPAAFEPAPPHVRMPVNQAQNSDGYDLAYLGSDSEEYVVEPDGNEEYRPPGSWPRAQQPPKQPGLSLPAPGFFSMPPLNSAVDVPAPHQGGGPDRGPRAACRSTGRVETPVDTQRPLAGDFSVHFPANTHDLLIGNAVTNSAAAVTADKAAKEAADNSLYVELGSALTALDAPGDDDGDNAADNSHEANNSYTGPDFTPIVELPEKYDLVTGEEEATVLYSVDRVRMYRFIDNQWKERGVGPLKLLLDGDSHSGARVLMRREQVHKVCANHYVRADHTISFKEDGNECRLLIWTALDFADDAAKASVEQFCCKFRTRQVAVEFKRQFELARQQAVNTQKSKGTDKNTEKLDAEKEQGGHRGAEGDGRSLVDQFKPAAGSWDCQVCLVRNGSDDTACAACATVRPGSQSADTITTPKTSISNVPSPAAAFSFSAGIPANLTSTPASKGTSGFQVAFGSPAIKSLTQVTVPSQPAFTFGASSNEAITFGALSKQSDNTFGSITKQADTELSFGSLAKQPDGSALVNKPADTIVFGAAAAKTPVFGAASIQTVVPTFEATGKQTPSVFGNQSDASKDRPVATAASKFDISEGTKSLSGNSDPSLFGGKTGSNLFAPQKEPINLTGKVFDTQIPTVKIGAASSTAKDNVYEPAGSSEMKQMAELSKGLSSSSADISSTDVTKNTVGGFSFIGKPVVMSEPVAPAKVVTEAKPVVNPFSTFTFGSCSEQTSFAKLAAAGEQPAAFTTSSKSDGSEFVGAQLFQQTGDGDHAEEFVPTGEFEAVVTLPEVVDLVTGEEAEEKLFEERAKLYRLDTASQQWKERGIGQLRLLTHTVTGQCRVVMRREQVLKVCANHRIASSMSLQPLATSDRAWCWSAHDYSDSEDGVLEHLAAKFKTPEIAARFKQVFEECLTKEVTAAPVASPVVTSAKGTPATAAAATSSLAELFKAKEGEWQCDCCLVRNMANVNACAACQTLRPGAEPPAAEATTSDKPVTITFGSGGGFQFGGMSSPADFSSGFGGVPTTSSTSVATTSSDFSFVSSFGKPASGTVATTSTTTAGFSFGSGFGAPASSATTTTATTGFSFGSSFGAAASGASTTTSTTTAAFSFGSSFGMLTSVTSTTSTATTGFSFGSTFAAPSTATSTTATGFSFGSTFGTPSSSTSSTTTSGFSFGSPFATPASVTSTTTTSTATTRFSFGSSFVTPASDTVTSSSASGFGFTFTPNTKSNKALTDSTSFPSPASGVFTFGSSDVKPSTPKSAPHRLNETPTSPELYENVDGDDSHIQFEPVVQLPEAVAVVTGEEEEEVAWQGRARLYRFVDNEWKERGVGVVKLLRDGTAGRTRILMRRDQVLKICLNHVITASLELLSMPGCQERAWLWHAADFADATADETPVHQQFALRFKTKDIANEFKSEFDAAKIGTTCDDSILMSLLSDTDVQDASDKDAVILVGEEKASAEQVARARQYQLPDHFYLYEMRPPCTGCIGCKDDDDDDDGDTRKAADVCANVTTVSNASEPIAPVFGSSIAKSKEAEPSVGTQGGLFGGDTQLSWASLAANAANDSFQFAKKSSSFTWQGAGQALFSSPQPGAVEANATTADDDDGVVEQGADVHFEPVVSLPEVKDQKTGEEDHDVLFKQRAKLYRFTDGQWKERGVGDMKLLKHVHTGVVRVLMRREQVLKLACNHNLCADTVLQPLATSETAWCWSALDYASGEPQHEQLAVKFKTKELATLFKEKFEECVQSIVTATASVTSLTESSTVDDEDITLLCEPFAGHGTGNDEDYASLAEDVADQLQGESLSQLGLNDEYRVYAEALASELAAARGGSALLPAAQPKHVHFSDGDTATAAEVEDGEQEVEEEEEEEDEEASVMFSKRVTMSYVTNMDNDMEEVQGMGEMSVLYDDDVNGSRIQMKTDDGQLVCNHIICRGYYLQQKPGMRMCDWMAKDFSTDEPVTRNFRVQFSSANALEEFAEIFAEGVEMARESEIDEVRN